MSRQSRVSSFALLSLVALVAPAGAQNFLRSSTATVPSGHFGIEANPTWLLGRDGGPDRFGGAARLGYGISDSFDAAGKLGVFGGFTLVGLDAGFWFLRSPIDMQVSVGAHKALIDDARDTSAFDVAWLAMGRVNRRLDLSGGVTASFESIDGTTDSGFTRVYVGPGLRYRVSRSVDFQTQVGIGLNRHSPSYLSVGFATYLPVTDAASRRERR
jgi:hypothetical protein